MAKKNADPAKAKAAKQKKIAIVGTAFLLVLMAVEVPMIMKRMNGPQVTTPAASAATAPAPGTPAPVPGAAPGTPVSLAAPTLAGANPTAAAPTTGGTLVADPAPTPGQGQLAAFTRFASKDPFASQSDAAGAPTGEGPASTGSSDSGSGSASGSGSGGGQPAVPTPPSGGSSGSSGGGSVVPGGGSSAPTAPTPALGSAVISVNRRLEAVATGGVFPAAQPVFKLVSVTAHAAKIAVAGGTYATGDPTITLRENKSVTLMNTADGTRYTLELLPQGTAIPAALASPSAAPAPTPSGTGG